MISINLLPDVKKDLLRVRRERNLVVTVSVIAVGVSVGILFILGATLGGMTVAKMATESSIESNEKKIDDAIKNDQLNRYLTIQNQLSQIDGLKGEQQIYSRLMDYLVALNPAAPNNATLQNVMLSSSGSSSSSSSSSADGITVTLEGSTADFASLNVYKNTLINAQISYEEESDDDADTDSSSNQDDDEGSGRNNVTENTEAIKENLFTSVEVTESNLSTDSRGSTVSFTIVAVFNPRAFDSTIDDSSIKIEIPHETTSDGDRNAPTTGNEDESSDNNETNTSEVFHTDETTGESTIEGGTQ
mgnify:CR=1 FL=1